MLDGTQSLARELSELAEGKPADKNKSDLVADVDVKEVSLDAEGGSGLLRTPQDQPRNRGRLPAVPGFDPVLNPYVVQPTTLTYFDVCCDWKG